MDNFSDLRQSCSFFYYDGVVSCKKNYKQVSNFFVNEGWTVIGPLSI